MNKYSALIFLLCVVPISNAAVKECTKYEAYAAESLYPYLSSWNEMHMAYRAFGHCDDGSVAEGFDESISLLWEKHWELVPKMLKEITSDSGFKQFVYKRIGSETIPMERWRRIVNYAKAQCPSNANSFCKEVVAHGAK